MRALPVLLSCLFMGLTPGAPARAEQTVPPPPTTSPSPTPAPPFPQARTLALEHLRTGMQAYARQDFAAWLTEMQAAVALRPDHPSFRYNLAGALTLTGQPELALQQLSLLADWGLALPADQDSDFDALKNTPGFQAVMARMAIHLKPQGSSTVAFTLSEQPTLAEGLAYDPKEKAFYIGSVQSGRILKRTLDGKVVDFSRPEDGLWSVFGMTVDARRGELWVSSSAVPQRQGLKPEDRGRAGLFRYALRSGRLLGRYLLPTGGEHVLGDVTLDAQGNVYATDSISPALYVLKRQQLSGPKSEPMLEKVVEGDPFVSPQGLAFLPNGRLMVADYAGGLYAVDLAKRRVTRLDTPPSMLLLGLDGLYADGRGLVAIQNGMSPPRVVRITVTETAGESVPRVESLSVLAANAPFMEEPSLGVLTDGRFYFIANSQWEKINEHGQVKEGQTLQAPVILQVSPLERSRAD